jgi:hypothetical protein
MDFSKTLFRCSSLGKIMTDGGGVTREKYLRQLHRELKYGRRKEFTSKYTEKGLQVEEDAITLYSRVKKTFFKKNSERLNNSFITGEPDLFTGLEIRSADTIIDTKASWDLFTFPYPTDKPDKNYYWQMQGYMALTGAKSATLAFCLVNTPETLINDEKRKLLYKMNAGTDLNPDYIEASEELERSMIFDDIPMEERVIEFTVTRNDKDIAALYNRIDTCREYLCDLENSLSKKPGAIIAQYDPKVNTTIVQEINNIPLIKIAK